MNILALLFILIGGILLFFAYKKYQGVKEFIQKAVTVEGKVIEVKEHIESTTDSDGYTTNTKMYTPVIEFKTQAGETIVFTAQVSTANKNAWHVDQAVVVLYDPKNVKNAKIDKRSHLYLVPIVLGILGIVFLAIGGIMLGSGN